MKKWAAEYVREPLGIPDCLSLIRLLRGEERTLRAVHERCAAKPIDIGKTLELNNFKKLLAECRDSEDAVLLTWAGNYARMVPYDRSICL